ncbi:MAG: hypothetical protein JNN23_15765 [Chryseobacterium gambrini]|nr:hypothetical protein [Chryseobacterium gambrini]
MKLEDLVKYLGNSMKFDELYDLLKLNKESEALLIYMEDQINLESDTYIFEIEETDDYLTYENSGLKFIQLFPLEMAQEMVEEYLNIYNNITSHEIAQRLIDYRINDA